MNNSTSTFKQIYDTFVLIYSKKITILLFVLSFTILGFVNYHYKILFNGHEQKIITDISSNSIHSEIITSYLVAVNDMDTDQKMINLKLTKSEANSLNQIQCFLIPMPAVNSDLNIRSIVRLEIKYSNGKSINKIINHLIQYLYKQPFIIDKNKKFNHLLLTKKALIKNMDYEIKRIENNKFTLNDFLEYNNINTIDLFKFRLKLETEVLDSASITIVNKGVVKNYAKDETIILLKSIIGYPILGIAIAILFIYFNRTIQIIKKEKNNPKN